MIPLDVFGVQADPTQGAPMVLLREQEAPHRILPIFVGAAEAAAIAVGMSGTVPPRPLTHDLLIAVLDRTQARVDRVDVTEVHDGVFLAELSLTGPGGTHQVSSRPSDAIALAVRLGVPVFAAEDVLDEAGAVLVLEDDEEETDETPELDEAAIEAELSSFRDFLDELSPGDFGTGAEPATDEPATDEPGADEP